MLVLWGHVCTLRCCSAQSVVIAHVVAVSRDAVAGSACMLSCIVPNVSVPPMVPPSGHHPSVQQRQVLRFLGAVAWLVCCTVARVLGPVGHKSYNRVLVSCRCQRHPRLCTSWSSYGVRSKPRSLDRTYPCHADSALQPQQQHYTGIVSNVVSGGVLSGGVLAGVCFTWLTEPASNGFTAAASAQRHRHTNNQPPPGLGIMFEHCNHRAICSGLEGLYPVKRVSYF